MSTWRSRKRGSDTSLVPSNRFGIESSWRDLGKLHQSCLLCGSQQDRHDGLGGETFRHFRSFAFCERIFQRSLILFSSNIMATKSVSNALRSAFAATRPRSRSIQTLRRSTRQRSIHQSAKIPAITSSQARHRPILQPHHQPSSLPSPNISLGTRTIFIQTQSTPNVDVSPSPPEM